MAIKWISLGVSVMSLLLGMLLGNPFADWVNRVAAGDRWTWLGMWTAVLALTAGVIVAMAYLMNRIERFLLLRWVSRHEEALDNLRTYAKMCMADAQQLHDEAADEQNPEVDWQHYREMARMLEEKLVEWPEHKANLGLGGLPLWGPVAVHHASRAHYDLEIAPHLSDQPDEDKRRERFQQIFWGARCVEKLTQQLMDVTREAKDRAKHGLSS
jgi:hypothetical protein